MIYRILRSLLVTTLLAGFFVGIFSAWVSFGINPLTGGESAKVSIVSMGIHSVAESSVKHYSRKFAIADGSKLAVTLKGVRATESLLDFRTRGQALVSYDDGISSVGVASVSYRDVSHSASEVGLEKVALSGKDSLAGSVGSGEFVFSADTSIAKNYVSQVVIGSPNPHVGGSQAPPNETPSISLTTA